MSNPYVIEKQRIAVQALLPNHPVETLSIFLDPNALRAGGYCRPSELFERSEFFLSTVNSDDELLFLARDAIMALAVPAHLEETDADASQDASRENIEVLFEDGTRLLGTIFYLLPEDHCRPQDYLMQDSSFFRMWSKETVYIINKRRVASVRPLGNQNGVV